MRLTLEGWQLLFYDQEQFDDMDETLSKGVFISISIAAAIYILVGFVITTLIPEEAGAAQPEPALLYGALLISKWLAVDSPASFRPPVRSTRHCSVRRFSPRI